MRYDIRVTISYQDDLDNIYIELMDENSGNIIITGTALKKRSSILNCVDHMLREHLPESE